MAVALVLVYFAARVGATWDSVANPTPNVRVSFADGRVEIGSLSRTWSGDYLLSTNDGRVVVFDDEAHRGMTWSRPETPRSFLSGWRALLAPLLVVVIWLSMALQDILRWSQSAGGRRGT